MIRLKSVKQVLEMSIKQQIEYVKTLTKEQSRILMIRILKNLDLE